MERGGIASGAPSLRCAFLNALVVIYVETLAKAMALNAGAFSHGL
jgi:hypothetical protein